MVGAGFQLDVSLWSISFWIDVVVDIFFVADMLMNFRTAYYDHEGVREDRTGRMASNYLTGWFVIDFFVVCIKFHFSDIFVLSCIGSNLVNVDAPHGLNYHLVDCTWHFFVLVCWLFRATWPQNGGFGTHLHLDATDEISKYTDRID